MIRRFRSVLRAFAVAAIVVQLVFPPAPAPAQVLASATLAATPSSAFTGDTITFTGTVTGRGIAFTLNFGDGATAALPTPTTAAAVAFSETHVYAANRASVVATVSTAGGVLARIPVTLNTATIAGPAGSIPMTLSASFTITSTTTAPLPAGTFAIDWGDGTARGSSPIVASATVTHAYANAGTFTVSLIDPAGTTISRATVTITALTTTIVANPNPVQAGTSTNITFTGSARVGGVAPTVAVAFGDGATTTYPYSSLPVVLAHTYARAGSYTVTATINATRVGSATVTVVTPTFALATSPNPSLVGGSVTITTTATVPAGSVPPATLTLAYGDGASAVVPFTSATYTHAYATAGAFTLTASAGGTTYATASQSVLAPGATLSATNGVVGQPITATIGVTALGALPGPNLVVTFGDGSSQTIPYAATSLTHAYAAAGTYTITVGPAGNVAPYATTTTTIAAPTIALTSSKNPDLTGKTVTFTLAAMNGSGSVTVAFGDGATTVVPFANGTVTHAYAAAGTFAVSVTSSNGATLAALTETIYAPGATLSAAPNPATAGSPTTVAIGVAAIGGLTGPRLVVNFGDGSATQTVPYAATSLPHTYASPGVYSVTVTPEGGTVAYATLALSVTGASSVSLTSTPNPSFAGTPVSFGLSVNGAGGPLTIAFGDGTTQSVPFANATLTHTYAAAGTYSVTATATAGGPVLFTLSQTVVALSATLVPTPSTGLAGSPIGFALGVGAIGAAPPPTLTVNYGDGSAPQSVPYAAATLSHIFTAPGQYTVVVTAPGVATPLATAAVTILSPMVSLTATPNPQLAGSPVAVALTVNSIPAGIAPSLVVNYGDGTSSAVLPFASTALSHTYLVAGTFTITASVPGSATPLFSLPVRVVAPSATLTATPNPVLAGANVSFALGVASLAGLTGPNLVVNYGDGTATATVPYAATTLTHAYAKTGTYSVSVVAAGSTTLLASASVTVMAPSASLAVTPNPQLAGSPVSIALTVASLSVAGPNLTVTYGDGSAPQTIPYGNATLTHTYAKAGTYAIGVSDGTGAVNATSSVQIVAPGATLMIAPNPALVGNPTGVTVIVTALGGLPAPTPLTVTFGDGTSQQIAYATATIAHTYTAVGSYAVTVSAPGGTAFATANAVVVQQAQALAVQTPTVNAGAPAQIMVSLVPPGGFAANPETLLFGDGTQTTVRASGLYPHAYGAPGIYTVRLVNPANGATFATSQVTVNGIAPRVPIGQIFGTTFTLSPVLAGDETNVIVQFSIAVPTLASTADPIEAYVDLTTTKGKLIRRTDLFEILPAQYSGPGVKSVKIPFDTPLDAAGTYLVKVTLMSAQGGTIVTGSPATLIIIGGPDPLPKLETDFHSTGAVEVGPHAGQPGVTFDPSITNALLFPTYSVGLTGLFDPVSRRSDPVLSVKSGAPPAQQPIRGPTQTPPPAPAGATAAPQVGATVPAAPLPSPPGPLAGGAVSGAAAYAGSLANVTSPVPAGAPGTPAPSGPNAPGIVGTAPPPTASPAPVGTPIVARGFGTPTPVTATASPPGASPSPASTPITAPGFGTPTPVNGTPPPGVPPPGVPPPAAVASPSHPYQEIFGRGQATLPGLLGGSTTLRGLDLLDSTGVGPTSYQIGYGDTSLGTATTGVERGAIADIARTFDGTGIARVTYFGRQDDPVTYAPTTYGTGPLVADAEVFEFTSPTLGPLVFTATGGLSEAHSLAEGYRVDDAADKFTLALTKPKYNFTFDYHNAGSLFAVGGGAGAASDRVGFASASTIQLATVASLALGYSKDETRSAFSRQSDAFATFNFTLPKSDVLQISVKRDTQVTPTTDTDSDTGLFNFGGRLGIATVSLNGSLTATRDYIDAINGNTTRTLSAQFAVQQNAHALGIGVNATDLSGLMPNATIGESLTYGFPFFGHLVNGALVHGFELQLSATNTASHSPTTGTADEGLAAILSYHINSHLAFGVRPEYSWHQDEVKANDAKASALRLRLDLTQ